MIIKDNVHTERGIDRSHSSRISTASQFPLMAWAEVRGSPLRTAPDSKQAVPHTAEQVDEFLASQARGTGGIFADV